MGIVERKEREKLEKRELILVAATKMFLEDGYEKTSIRNIAEQIEYSPATIYLYFKDKDELFFAIHEIGFQKLLKEIAKAKTIKNPLKRLHEIGKIYIEFALNNPEYYDLMFIMRAPMNAIKERFGEEMCWQYGETTFTVLLDTINECIALKLVKTKNPMIGAMYTWSAVHGMVSLYIRDRYGVMKMTFEETKVMMMESLNELMNNLKA